MGHHTVVVGADVAVVKGGAAEGKWWCCSR